MPRSRCPWRRSRRRTCHPPRSAPGHCCPASCTPGRSRTRRRCRPTSPVDGGPRLGGPGRPVETLGAAVQAVQQPAVVEGLPGLGVPFGLVALAQVDRVDAARDRELVHGDLVGPHAGHLPGARIHEGTATSSRASRWLVRRFGAAYIIRVGTAVCSAYSLIAEVCSWTRCSMAESTPSRLAPSRKCEKVASGSRSGRTSAAGSPPAAPAGLRWSAPPAPRPYVGVRDALAAEPAADVLAPDAHLLGLETPHRGQRLRDAVHALGGVLQGQVGRPSCSSHQAVVACGSIGLLCS